MCTSTIGSTIFSGGKRPSPPVDQNTGTMIQKRPSPLQSAMSRAQEQLDMAEQTGVNALKGLQLAAVNPTGVPDLKNYLGFLIPKRRTT